MSKELRAIKSNRQLMLVHIDSDIGPVYNEYLDIMPNEESIGYVAEISVHRERLDNLLNRLTLDGWWLSTMGKIVDADYTMVFYRDLETYDV